MAGLAFDLTINEMEAWVDCGPDSITRFTGARNYFNAKRMVAMFGEARDIESGGDIARGAVLGVTEQTGLRRADAGEFPKVGVVKLSCPFVSLGEHGRILSLAMATGADRHLRGAFVETEAEALALSGDLVGFVEGVAVATFLAAGQVERELGRLADQPGFVAILALTGEVKVGHLVGRYIRDC